MDRQNFIDMVQARRSPMLPQIATERAIKFFVEVLNTTQWDDVHKCIELAGYFAEGFGEDKPGGPMGVWSQMEVSPERLMSNKQMYAFIKAEVEAVRRKIFRHPEPPFANYKEAVSWLESEARKESPDRKNKKAFDRAYREWIAKGQELQKHTNGIVRCGLERKTITYAKPDDEWTRSVVVDRGTSLATLEAFIRKASNQTGFSQPALVIHVLTPIRPVLPRWRLSYTPPLPFPGPARRIQVALLTQNVTSKDFRGIYRAINVLLRRKKAAHIDKIDQILFEAVNQLGGVPSKGKMKFWRAIWTHCRSQGVRTFKAPDAARIRYKRLQKKLEALRHYKPKNSVGGSKPRAHAGRS